MSRAYIIFALIWLGLGSAIAGRPGAWRCERVPGSARLELSTLRWIVLPSESEQPLRAAAEDLRQLLLERCGAELSLLSGVPARPKFAILLELTGGLNVRGDGGFTIHREGSRIYVMAADANGLLNGVYALCCDVLGARWYWEGDLGFEWVGDVPGKFPERRWREKPAFVQRQLHPVNTEFGRRNRLNRRFSFNHNLAKVFTRDLYEVEPDAFSTLRGSRREPSGSGGRDAQPNFTSSRAVELAAEAAIRHFKDKPGSLSFSLSINDNVLFDDSRVTEEAVRPLSYFRSRPNYTDLVFRFMNEVAELVFEEAGMWETPEGNLRYLTALAYYWTEQSPSFQLHSRVVPVLTSDRAQWHDPNYRAEDQALIDRWVDSGAERIATWDYYFGAPYPYPRQFSQWMIESLRYLEGAGVDTFFSQLPSFWGLDGAKSWLATELLWNPGQDAETLLEEYYTHFFGAAAQPMRRFYEIAEVHRNVHEGKADWIKFYKDEAGIELFGSKVLMEMRQQLELARALVVGDERRLARVTIASDAFSFTERYAAFQVARTGLVHFLFDHFSGAGLDHLVLEGRLQAYEQAQVTYEAFGKLLMEEPLHRQLKPFLRLKQTDPRNLAEAAVALNGGVELAGMSPVYDNVNLQHGMAAPLPRDFLGPDLPDLLGWHFDLRASESLRVEPAGKYESGESGVRISGADVLSMFRDAPVRGGSKFFLDVDVAWQVSPDNRTQFKVNWYNAEGKIIRVDLPLRLPNGVSRESQRVVLSLEAPEEALLARVHFTMSRQYPGDFFEVTRVDLRLVD